MVVPIYDDNPFTQPVKPVVTWCLIAANVAKCRTFLGAGRQASVFGLVDTTATKEFYGV